MFAVDYIDPSIPFLKDTDAVEKGLDWMEEYKLQHLPVVEASSKKFLGIVSEELLLSQVVGKVFIKDTSFFQCDIIAREDEMILDVVERCGNLDLDVVPVVNDSEYVGILTTKQLFQALVTYTTSPRERCSFLVLRMSVLDYSLQNIARIVESNGEKVLNSYVRDVKDIPEKIDLVLKINTDDLSRVIAELGQLDYTIVYVKSSHEAEDASKANYLNFIKYLDI